ncbi:ninjurin-2-like isoform X3 [Uloborus diversus]|uniref:ninjurin-2-like isoform X3 n=1 Tax=Uloborus diversus TaxID=327109 RepID=UPI002408F3A5|nr:ninjurin-2-like isoform X3 [Uloborus diversus]
MAQNRSILVTPRGGGIMFQKIGGNEPSGKGMPGTRMLDANVYATKKTIAQGLLDVALLTANASQLKYLLQAGKEHEFYYVMMTLISLSIILQMALGIVLLLKGQCDINNAASHCRANILNDAAVWLVFASAVVHAFLSVFHIDPGLQPPFSTYANYNNKTIPGEEYSEGFPDAES